MSGRGWNKNDQQQILLDIHVGEGVGGEPCQHRGEARAGLPGGHQQHRVGGRVSSAGHQQWHQNGAKNQDGLTNNATWFCSLHPCANARHKQGEKKIFCGSDNYEIHVL